MTKVLQCTDNSQQLATRGTIVALSRIHNSRKELNGSLYAINFLGEDSSHSNIRGVRVQNAWLLKKWEGQRGSLNQGLLQGIERLLHKHTTHNKSGSTIDIRRQKEPGAPDKSNGIRVAGTEGGTIRHT